MSTTKKTIITLLAVLAVSTALAGENLPMQDRYQFEAKLRSIQRQ